LGAREHMLRSIDNLIEALHDLRQDLDSQDAAALTRQLANAQKGHARWWRERNTANWGAAETAPKMEMPTAKDFFGRMVGMRQRRRDTDSRK